MVSISAISNEIMEMLASDIQYSAVGPSLGQQASHTQHSTLEMRVIALETKLRHHKPEHPCDCKYELSLLEEKLGALDEHPWENRLSAIEKKQRRDAKDVSRLWKDLRDCQDRTDTLMVDHHWASDKRKCADQAVGSMNLLYVMEQTSEKLKEFEKFRDEVGACLWALKKRCDGMEHDIRRVQPWMISQMVEKQQNVADKIVRLNGDTKALEGQMGELMTLESVVSKQLQTISSGVDSKVSELEKAIAGIACQSTNDEITEDNFLLEVKPETIRQRQTERQMFYYGNNSERSIWVPPTSVEPTHTPYTHGIPMVLEQPKGWGDVRAEICRELEESQKVYFSSQQDQESQVDAEDTDGEDIKDIPVAKSSEEFSTNKPESPRKRRRRRRKRSNSVTQAADAVYVNEQSEACPKLESQQPDENVKPEVSVFDGSLTPSDPCHPASPTPSMARPRRDCRDVDTDTKFFGLFAKSLSPKKSKTSLRKSRSKTIGKSKDKQKYISVSEVFRQSKEMGSGKHLGKTVLDSGTISGLEALLLR
ncbi:hypothetical protein TWF281_005431 [Arthrobotrys megalospora]